METYLNGNAQVNMKHQVLKRAKSVKKRVYQLLVATFRVARFTLQNRKLWLVGRSRARLSRALPLTCPIVKKRK